MNSGKTRRSSSSPLQLTGHDLTLNGVMDVARWGIAVEIEKRAASRLSEARKLLYDLMNEGIPIYGGNTGVGWNKDISVTQECLARFNANLLHSHAVGVRPYVTEEEARAILLVRLNTLLVGCTGIDPGIPQMYVSFLNRGIIPLIPERGSVGQADIGCLSHVGLAMMGEGTVRYKGRDIPAMEALRAEGLSPVSLGPRDGLAIVSSNALASGQAAVALFEAEELMRASEIVYALSLEGFGGNTSSLNLKSHQLHGFEESASSALRISRYLEGSYIHKVREGRPLQDPLCYRNAAHLYGAGQRALESARSALTIHFNHSDDNPCLLLDERAVVSCSNFDSLPWVLELETVTVVLSHLSKACCMRAIRVC